MKSGWLGGIAAGLVFVVAWSAQSSLFINGRLVSVAPAVRSEGSSILVPVAAFAPLLGIESVWADGRWAMRWSKGCDQLASWELRDVGGVAYALLDGLVARVGGELRNTREGTQIEVPGARLIEFGVRDGEVIVRLDRFCPTLVTEEDGFQVISFSNCSLGVAETVAQFGPGGIGSATLADADGARCEVRVSFLDEAALAVRRLESESGYTVFLAPSESRSITSTTVLATGFSFFEGDVLADGNPARVEVVTIDGWRERLDVRPLLPPAGAGTQARVDEVLAGAGATVALSARSDAELGLVVIQSVPFSLGENGAEALGIDVFGSLVALVATPTAFAVSEAARIPLDGVDRPIGHDEVIGYPPGYTGSIARAFPGRFCVVRVRDSAIVSILDASYVVADPSATLLVASGAACVRLAGLSMGDRVSLACDIDPGRRFISDALSVTGALLWNGQAVQGEAESAAAWSLVGTDWQGGLFFLRASCDTGLTGTQLLAILARLPAPARDAVVLERGASVALALDLAGYHPRWGETGPISLALGAFLR